MRYIKPPKSDNEEPKENNPEWRIAQLSALYARQSTTRQTIENKESSKLQTTIQLKRMHKLGWTDDTIVVFIEGDGKRGVSGRLRIDQRTGLKSLLEGVYDDTIKTVFVVNEARLFRDEIQVQVSTFIQACYDHDVIVVTTNYKYDFRRHPGDIERFRHECEVAAKFLTGQLEYMREAKDQAALEGRYVGFGISVGYILDRRKYVDDEENPRYNYYIIYEPHAKVVRWIFRRYFELGGDLQELGHELETMLYVFPFYESSVRGPRTILKPAESGEGFSFGRVGLISVLTNPVYLGHWMYQGRLVKRHNHFPILKKVVDEDGVERDYEQYFWYAFNRLSPTTLEGELNPLRIKTPVRYDQQGKPLSEALLKEDGIIKSPDAPVYIYKRGNSRSGEAYGICPRKQSQFSKAVSRYLSVSDLDAVYVQRMIYHIKEWKQQEEGIASLGATLYERLQEEKRAKDKETVSIPQQLVKAEKQIAHYDRLIDKGYGLDDETLEKYGKKLTGLRRLKAQLEQRLNDLTTNEADIQESSTLADRALADFNGMSLASKRRLVRLVTEHVIITEESPRWMRIEILWKGIGIPTVDTGYLFRPSGTNPKWKPEENEILRQLYPQGNAEEILEKLPGRTWRAIIAQAHRKKVKRFVQNAPHYEGLSLADIRFMEEKCIELLEEDNDQFTYWTASLYLLPSELEEKDAEETEELINRFLANDPDGSNFIESDDFVSKFLASTNDEQEC